MTFFDEAKMPHNIKCPDFSKTIMNAIKCNTMKKKKTELLNNWIYSHQSLAFNWIISSVCAISLWYGRVLLLIGIVKLIQVRFMFSLLRTKGIHIQPDTAAENIAPLSTASPRLGSSLEKLKHKMCTIWSRSDPTRFFIYNYNNILFSWYGS